MLITLRSSVLLRAAWSSPNIGRMSKPTRFGRTDAGKRGQIGVDEQDAPLAVGRADHRRNGVDDLRQPLARIAQRFLARALGILELLREVFGAAAS